MPTVFSAKVIGRALLLALLGWSWLAVSLSHAQGGGPGPVHVLTAKGTVNPVLANYIERGIAGAERRGAQAVVIQLDTPGGLDTSMREIVQRMLSARLPVIVFVAPAGARAASAGAFIAMGSHVAAMAPGTAIGAAHPVALGQQGEAQQLPRTMEEKVENDAVAYITELARAKGRNVEWAEKAVRQSISSGAEEAKGQRVVELVARDLGDLLAQLDGRTVPLLAGSASLATRDARVVHVGMSFFERFLFAIADPNIAFILFGLALTGLAVELLNPGAIFPGVVGGIALVLALFSLGTLPVNYAGLALMGVAFALFVAEFFVASHGLLGIGGVVSLALGGIVLFSSSSPLFIVDRRLLGGVVGGVAILLLVVVRKVIEARRLGVAIGQEGMVGMRAVARTALAPEGFVFLEGERWTAQSESGPIQPGEEVVVTRVEGLRLFVSRPQQGGA
ncbi:MAG: nodulation protein NfeD [Chloroflexi bacterium]|nr:nodulation protein NfeD [Chloroflexota bacterium]